MHHILASAKLFQILEVFAWDYLKPGVVRVTCQRNLSDNLSMQIRSPVACVLVNDHNVVVEVVDVQRSKLHETLCH